MISINNNSSIILKNKTAQNYYVFSKSQAVENIITKKMEWVAQWYYTS